MTDIRRLEEAEYTADDVSMAYNMGCRAGLIVVILVVGVIASLALATFFSFGGCNV